MQIAISLVIQFIKHCLHLTESVTVAGTCRASYSGFKTLNRFRFSIHSRQCLRSHEVARGVIRIVRQKYIELGQSGRRITLAHQFHGNAVSGEAVLRIERQDFLETIDFVHLARIWPDFNALDREDLRNLRGLPKLKQDA